VLGGVRVREQRRGRTADAQDVATANRGGKGCIAA
jgi:hypothetical protein